MLVDFVAIQKAFKDFRRCPLICERVLAISVGFCFRWTAVFFLVEIIVFPVEFFVLCGEGLFSS